MGRAMGGNFLSSSSSTAVKLGATQMSDKREDGRTEGSLCGLLAASRPHLPFKPCVSSNTNYRIICNIHSGPITP